MELDSDLFIRLSWNIYFQKNSHMHSITTYYSDLSNLVATTKLNSHILSHSLYYLYLLVKHKSSLYQSSSSSSSVQYSSFQSCSREKLLSGSSRKSSKELFELIVVLMMISNKSNDDSSYTMKTWENLTPLTIPVLKKREITILKKINYNVFLKEESYNKWSTQLYNLAIKYELLVKQPELSQYYIPELDHSKFQEQPLEVYMNYPLTPKSPLIDIITTNNNLKRSHYDGQHYNSNNHNTTTFTPVYKKPKLTPFNELQTQLLTPMKFDSGFDLNFMHPQNCTCCYLTNCANIYHSTLMKSMVKL